jgi:small conductance mechanosensitive channel
MFDEAQGRPQALGTSAAAILPGLPGRVAGGVASLVASLVDATTGFRDVLQKLLAGIPILLTRAFRIGGRIRQGGRDAAVEDIGVRATVLRTGDDRRILPPDTPPLADGIEAIAADRKRGLRYPPAIGSRDGMGQAGGLVVQAPRATRGTAGQP